MLQLPLHECERKLKGIDKQVAQQYIGCQCTEHFYVGRVALIDIVSQNPATTLLKEMVKADYVVLNAKDDRETAVDMFRKYDREFLPVISMPKKNFAASLLPMMCLTLLKKKRLKICCSLADRRH